MTIKHFHRNKRAGISIIKDEGLRPQDINDFGDRQEKEWIKIYQIYQDTCDRAGLVDFAELLIRAYELFAKSL